MRMLSVTCYAFIGVDSHWLLQVTKAIADVAEAFKVHPCETVESRQLKRFTQHPDKVQLISVVGYAVGGVIFVFTLPGYSER